MPSFILIHETTRHCCHVTTDEIRQLIDIRYNPGGYSDVDHCMAMIQCPDQRGPYVAFPFTGPMGQMSIHVEGRMDFSDQQLKWKEPGHRCEPRCLVNL